MVTDDTALRAVCERLAGAGSFGMDMEFRREKTYLARLDLVQVASVDEVALVDPHADVDLQPLLDLIADPRVEVIVHSGRQDLEIAYELGGVIPANVFDTQIAGALVGFGEQVPYDRLLSSLVGKQIGKLETTSDWSRRPLTERQVSYAVDDVRYLPELRRKLGEELESRGRTEWAAEEMASLHDAATYDRDGSELWRSVSGSGRLKRRELAVLRELAIWREELARRRDLPRRWVLPDDVLLDIARRAPERVEDIETISRLPEKVLKREGAEIVARVRQALDTPQDTWPKPASGREDPDVVAAADLLDMFLRIRAAETGVAQTYLATRKDLLAAVRSVRKGSGEQPPLLRGWRRELVGEDCVRIVQGEVSLRYDPDSGRVAVSRVGD